MKRALHRGGLNTVCEEACCPNQAECWGCGTATFMLLGEVCTRGCRFCAVTSGDPGGARDPEEPERVARAVEQMGLDYVVLTSVDRDDLPDGGADQFAETITEIRRRAPGVLIEALIPDFNGRHEALARITRATPEVIGHNVETVERLSPQVRDRRCGYRLSLQVLAEVKARRPETYTKSSLMLGLGEDGEEVLQTMRDLREAGVDLLTLGQYLQPTRRHLPVREFITPERFDRYRARALDQGFMQVSSGPLVRSSYRAGEGFIQARMPPEGRR